MRAIETTILTTDPALATRTFRIESRKRVVVEGVTHEIDVWVEVGNAPGYEVLIIFECKNQRYKVDKNEIIIFSEKIQAVSAQRGFFVAHDYTADARAQASRDRRIELLTVTSGDPLRIPRPFAFHIVETVGVHVTEASVTDIQDKTTRLHPISDTEIAALRFSVHGQDGAREDALRAILKSGGGIPLNDFRSTELAEGQVHRHSFRQRTDIKPFVVVLNEVPLASWRAWGWFDVQVFRPAIISHFSVIRRGRQYSFAPVNLIGIEDMKIDITMLDDTPDDLPTLAGKPLYVRMGWFTDALPIHWESD